MEWEAAMYQRLQPYVLPGIRPRAPPINPGLWMKTESTNLIDHLHKGEKLASYVSKYGLSSRLVRPFLEHGECRSGTRDLRPLGHPYRDCYLYSRWHRLVMGLRDTDLARWVAASIQSWWSRCCCC